jgi:hypothetical protein
MANQLSADTPSQNTAETVAAQTDAASNISHSEASDSGQPGQDLPHELPPITSGEDHPSTDVPIDDALVAALSSHSPDMVSVIDDTLHHLTIATDLFDIPPLDFHDGGSS